jgi:hypothetical protein
MPALEEYQPGSFAAQLYQPAEDPELQRLAEQYRQSVPAPVAQPPAALQPPAPLPVATQPEPAPAPEGPIDYSGGQQPQQPQHPQPSPAYQQLETVEAIPGSDAARQGLRIHHLDPIIPDEPPEPPSIGQSLAGGVARGATGLVASGTGLLKTAAEATAKWTGQDWVKNMGDAVDDWAKGEQEGAQKYAQPKGFYDTWGKDGTIHDKLNWLAAHGGEAGSQLGLGLVVKNNPAATTALTLYGATTAANEEAKRPGATWGSTIAAAANGAVQWGAPIGIMKAAEGLKPMARIAANALGMGAVGGAAPYTQAGVEAVASGEYKPPSTEQGLESGAIATALGILGGAVSGRRAAPEAPKPSPGTETPPPATHPLEPPPLPPSRPAIPGEPGGPSPGEPPLTPIAPRPGWPGRAEEPPVSPPVGEPGLPPGRRPGPDWPGGTPGITDPAVAAATEAAINPPALAGPPGTQGELPLAGGRAEVQPGLPLEGGGPRPPIPRPAAEQPGLPLEGTPYQPPLPFEREVAQPTVERPAPIPVRGPQEELPLMGGAYQPELPGGERAAPPSARPTEPPTPQPELPYGPTQQRLPLEGVTPPSSEAPAPPFRPPGETAARAAPAREAAAPEVRPRETVPVEPTPSGAAPPVTTPDIARPTARGRYTTEPDDIHPGRHVAKNRAGEVVGKGNTPERAVRDAVARKSEPYPPEPGERKAAGEPATATPAAARAAQATGGETAVKPAAAAGEPTVARPTTVVERRTLPTREVPPERQGRAAEELPPATRAAIAVGRQRGEEMAAAARRGTMAREAAAEVKAAGRGRPAQAVREPTARAPVETLGEGAAETVPTRRGAAETRGEGEGKAETMAKSTTDKDILYSNLLHDMLKPRDEAGHKTPAQAHAIAGSKYPGGKGRDRRHEDLAHYMEERINLARAGEAGDRALVDRMTEIMGDQSIKPAQRIAMRDRIAKDYQRRMAEREPDNLTKLEALRDSLHRLPGVRARAEVRAATGSEAARPGVVGAGKRAVLDALARRRAARGEALKERAWMTPEEVQARYHEAPVGEKAPAAAQWAENDANQRIARNLAKSEKEGTEYTLKNALDDITEHAPSRVFARPLYELAHAIKRMVSTEDIPVIPTQRLAREVGHPEYAETPGIYWREPGAVEVIGLREATSRYQGMAATAVHEGVHSGTAFYLDHIFGKKANGEKLTADQQKHYDTTNIIARETERVLRQGGWESQREAEGLSNALSSENGHELYTYLTTNPYVMDVMARTPASNAFKLDMKALGYSAPRTIWQAWVHAVADFFKVRPGSVLERAMHPITDIMEAGGEFGQAYRAQERYGLEMPRALMERQAGGGLRGETPTERRVREAVKPLTDRLGAVGNPVGKTGEAVVKAMTDVGSPLKATAKRWILAGGTMDHITRYNQDVLPEGRAVASVKGKQDATAQSFRDKWADNIKDWARQIKYGPEVGGLMTRATFNKAHLGDDINFEGKNSHLKGDALTKARELQQEFHDLPQAKQELYKNVRNYYETTEAETRQLAFENVIRKALPDASEAEIKSMGMEVRTKAGIERMINNPDATPMAQAFGERWQNNRPVVQEIGKVMRRGYVQGDYFPLRRYGNWVVKYGEPGSPDYGVHYFERRSQANDAVSEARARGEQVSEVLNKSAKDFDHKQFVPDSMFRDLDQTLERRGVSAEMRGEIRDVLSGLAMKAATHSEASLNRAKRNYVPGASEDQGRNLAHDLEGTGHNIGRLTWAADEARAYRDMNNQVKVLSRATTRATDEQKAKSAAGLARATERNAAGDPAYPKAEIDSLQRQHDALVKPLTSGQVENAQLLAEELNRRRLPVDGEDTAKMSGKGVHTLTTGSVLYHLMRPAHLVYQTMEGTANAQSILGGAYGQAAAAGAFARALRTAGPSGVMGGFRNVVNVARGQMRHADWNIHDTFINKEVAAGADRAHMEILKQAGLEGGQLGHSQAREIRQLANPGSFLGRIPTAMIDLFAAGEHAVDQTMRWSTLKAGFDLEMKRNGGNVEAAARQAVDHANFAIPNYANWNRNRWVGPQGMITNNPVGALAMQYHTYGLQMYTMMASLVRQAATRGGEERAVAIKSLAGLVGFHSLLAGASAHIIGAPLVGLVLGAWDMFHDKPGPHNYEDDLNRMATDAMGPTLGTIFSRGLVGWAGADAAQSLGLQNLMGLEGPRTFTGAGYRDAVMHMIGGAGSDFGAGVATAATDILNGHNIGKAAINLLPRMLADPAKAVYQGMYGVTDPRGKVIVPADKITPYQQALQSTGFRPYETALAQRKHSTGIEFRDEMHTARQRAMDRFTQSNGRDLTGIRSYMANPEYQRSSPINTQQIREAMKTQRESQMHPELYGLKIPKRQVPTFREKTAYQ